MILAVIIAQHTVFAALTVGFGFAAGYTVYSGSQAGRKAAIACFLFVIVGTFCLTGFLENVEQSVRDSIARSNAVRMMVPLFWILYFSFFSMFSGSIIFVISSVNTSVTNRSRTLCLYK